MLPPKTPSTPIMSDKMTPRGIAWGGLHTPAPGGAGTGASAKFGNSPTKQMLSKYKKQGTLRRRLAAMPAVNAGPKNSSGAGGL